MKIVCLDTHILIWGIKNESSPGQEEMIPKAKRFIKWLDDNKNRVIVPSVVVGELLMRVPLELHRDVNKLLEKHFIIAPFDSLAASHFANIWQMKESEEVINQLKEQFDLKREAIKVDCQIVAIAVARCAQCIYSYDPGVKKFGEKVIDVYEIPPIAEQLNIFNTE